jgi:hypothetical protein
VKSEVPETCMTLYSGFEFDKTTSIHYPYLNCKYICR